MDAPYPHTIMVPCSTQFLEQSGEWSRPVQVKVEKREDGTYDLIFRIAQYGVEGVG